MQASSHRNEWHFCTVLVLSSIFKCRTASHRARTGPVLPRTVTTVQHPYHPHRPPIRGRGRYGCAGSEARCCCAGCWTKPHQSSGNIVYDLPSRHTLSDGVTERGQLTRPMVRAATGFHRDLGRRQLLEEGDHLGAAQVRAQYRSVGMIHAVQGEDGFGRIDGYAFILGHGRLRSWLLTAPSLARDAVGPSTPTVLYKSCGDPFIVRDSHRRWCIRPVQGW